MKELKKNMHRFSLSNFCNGKAGLRGKGSKNALKAAMLVFFLFMGFSGYSQTSGTANTWTVLQNTPDYVLSSQVSTCNNQSIVFFKVENKTNSNKCFFINSRLKETGSTAEETLPAIYICTKSQQTFTGDCNSVNVPRGYIQKAVFNGTYAQPVVTATVVVQ